MFEVVGTMFFKDNKLLIDKPRKRATYQMIGGGVEEGETPLEAAIRECHEELGTNAIFDESKLELVMDFDEISTSDPNKKIHFYVFRYNGFLDGDLTLSGEIEGFLWYEPSMGTDILSNTLKNEVVPYCIKNNLIKEDINGRSIRKYIDQEISDNDIKEIIKAGMNAPSAYNSKPYEFIIVNDKKILLELSEIKPEASFVKWASRAIVLLADESKSLYWQQDLGATAQNMLLTATEKNIGSCWIGCTPDKEVERKAKDFLNIPDLWRVFAIISLGYSDRGKENNDYFDESKIHYNKF